MVRVGVGDNDDASEVTGERSAEDHADELLLQQEGAHRAGERRESNC